MLAGQQIGPFSVERELGSGAMGSVYRARYTKTGVHVAIKIVAPGLAGNEKAMERFEREAAILKQLKHPNIVRLYATGKYHGTPYYAMEYVEGESLDQVMARRGRISWEEVAVMGQQLCSALQHAHEQGIVHRDLKPSNLMVVPSGTLKLTDFGIAKDLDGTQLTSANCTVGTAAYMSPEQCRGERDLTYKSDLYSLGVVFYELITGHKPFRAETPMDMFLMHVQTTPERPSRQVLDLPVWFDTLICQLLEKKPEQRPRDAAAVSEALSRILEKVEAQQSAGVEVVRGKRPDKPLRRLDLDEHDRAAARTLLGKKSRRKHRHVPFYYHVWFKAVILTAVLAGVGFLFYKLVLERPSPEKLYSDAEEVMASFDEIEQLKASNDPRADEKIEKILQTTGPDEWDEARAGPIKDFLKYYPNRDDKEARQMRTWADKVDVYNLERRLRIWIQRGVEVSSETERTARSAVRLEEGGDLDEATKSWEGLAKKARASGGEERIWGLLAGKRLEDIKRVYAREDELTDKLTQTRKQARALKPDNHFQGQAARALHYALFGDIWKAYSQWRNLRQQTEKDSRYRVWFLLAARHVRYLEPRLPRDTDEKKARVKLVRKKLKEADDLKAKQPDEARVIYHDIVTLYGQDADDKLESLARDAKDRLKKL